MVLRRNSFRLTYPSELLSRRSKLAESEALPDASSLLSLPSESVSSVANESLLLSRGLSLCYASAVPESSAAQQKIASEGFMVSPELRAIA
jgi:hypothetical protein